MRLRFALTGLLCLAACCGSARAQSILVGICNDSATNPSLNAVIPTLLGSGVLNVTLFGDCDTNPNLFTGTFADAQNSSATTIKNVASQASVNHAPYPALAFPVRNQNPAQPDTLYYATLNAGGMMYAQARAFATFPANTPPGILSSYVSSPNSTDGTTGNGIEFGFSAGYMGFTTTSDSADAVLLSGVFASLKHLNPSWTWGDVKGALRQCASNWTSGYNASAYGFGFIDWTCASGIASTGAIYLQAPLMSIINNGFWASITLYPFRTTRRVKEVVYIGGTWPAVSAGNELTAAQIAAAGGTLVYTSNGTDTTPLFTYAPAVSGSATFYALTLDSSGNGSRVEEFNGVAETFTVGTACVQ